MLLKTITTFEDGTIDTEYIPLKSKISVTEPDVNGSFGGRKFDYESKTAKADTVAVITWENGEYGPIFIAKDQEAYLIGVDGKTISIIHKLPAIKLWYRDKSETKWRNMDDNADLTLQIAYYRDRCKSYPDLEFIKVREGTDPNNM